MAASISPRHVPLLTRSFARAPGVPTWPSVEALAGMQVGLIAVLAWASMLRRQEARNREGPENEQSGRIDHRWIDRHRARRRRRLRQEGREGGSRRSAR